MGSQLTSVFLANYANHVYKPSETMADKRQYQEPLLVELKNCQLTRELTVSAQYADPVLS